MVIECLRVDNEYLNVHHDTAEILNYTHSNTGIQYIFVVKLFLIEWNNKFNKDSATSASCREKHQTHRIRNILKTFCSVARTPTPEIALRDETTSRLSSTNTITCVSVKTKNSITLIQLFSMLNSIQSKINPLGTRVKYDWRNRGRTMWSSWS